MINPLKQYFRQPALYVRLPSEGIYYDETVIEPTETGDIPIFPMTAVDDITLRTPDALYNGTAVVNLLKSCVPNIKDPWRLSSIDVDSLLIAIRSASSGNEMEIHSICPECKAENLYGADLQRIMTDIEPAALAYNAPVKIGDITVTIRPLSYRQVADAALEQMEASRIVESVDRIESEKDRIAASTEAWTRIGEMTLDVVAKSVYSVETADGIAVTDPGHIAEFIRSCPRKTYELIRDKVSELRRNAEIKPLNVKCGECHHDYVQPVNLDPSDFFG